MEPPAELATSPSGERWQHICAVCPNRPARSKGHDAGGGGGGKGLGHRPVCGPAPAIFGELLQNQMGADVTFLVAGERIAAHRSMLAARSPVFMAELFGGMKEEASTCIEINDMEVEVFRTLLHFVYTDTVPELEKKGEQATVMAQHLLEAADRYGLERLKMICVEKVTEEISIDTVATTLALAEQHGCSELKSRCMKFILDPPGNLHAVAATEGFKHLEASCPSVLIELRKLMAKGNQ
ncbi:unnamed protein product [Urochloa humidicola]